MISKDPNIIIFSEQFIAGDAITTLNLFSKWNKKSLFCVSRYTDYFSNNFEEAYLLGDKEIHYRFPFKLFLKAQKSRIYQCSTEASRNSTSPSNRSSKKWFKLIYKLVRFCGLFERRLSYRLSDNLKSWINRINPEYIYTSVGSLEMAELIIAIIEYYPNIKVVYHAYDEWAKNSNKGISMKNVIAGELLLKQIIDRSSIRMVISEKMANYYNELYNKNFAVFCNPVNEVSITEFVANNNITFIGYIGNHNEKAIISLARSLALLDNDDIQLVIYSNVDTDFITSLRNIYPNVISKGWVNHKEIPRILRESRLLFLPISFEEHIINFTKYSMSTKMAEYLSSNVPILYLGPESIAMTEFLQRHKAAAVVTVNDTIILSNTLKSLLSDKHFVNTITTNAYKVFKERFELNKVASEFKQVIIKS